MILNLGTILFNANVPTGGTPSWGTELGQGDGYRFSFEDRDEFLTSMLYCAVADINEVTCPLGKGGSRASDFEFVLASLYKKVYVNGKRVKNGQFILLIVKQIAGQYHNGRRSLKYNPRMTYRGEEINKDCYNKIALTLGISENAAWFIDEINVKNQDELHFTAYVLDAKRTINYENIVKRRSEMERLRRGASKSEKKAVFIKRSDHKSNIFHTAIRTKPFLLLAGISGTGKSQIVKEMAFASCPNYSELRKDKVSPGNYCLIEVKPNWHDSTELLGYDSAIKKHYVVTKFVKFVIKAMQYPEVPFFVCLDEMNLAPVEQYFAEFLSVLESRKVVDGIIVSEALIDRDLFKNDIVALDLFDLPASEYKDLTNVTSVKLNDDALGENADIWHKLQDEGLCIPQNLIVIGTVNMDETTHQFSRKVIDRAMTFEMNEADFNHYFEDEVTLDYVNESLDANLFFSRNVSGKRAIEEFSNLDEQFKTDVAEMLTGLNTALEETPFKIAYRVQNELVIYFTELLRENAGADLDDMLMSALDDIMMMKVLPRIEGDDELLGNRSGGALHNLKDFAEQHNLTKSIDKIEEMLKRLERSHFTSFWP